eukprot:366391-Chlamydomonas_euryale.AAC.11
MPAWQTGCRCCCSSTEAAQRRRRPRYSAKTSGARAVRSMGAPAGLQWCSVLPGPARAQLQPRRQC